MADRSNPTRLSAYGGSGWLPRQRPLSEEMGQCWSRCGIDSEYRTLKSVLLHRPGEELMASQDASSVQMLEPLNIVKATQQHDALSQAYADAGVQVHYLHEFVSDTSLNPNQMFMADLLFMTPSGAILARPASEVRAGEEMQTAKALALLGIPILGSVHGYGTFEGADAMWLDKQTVILGRGLRTNDEGIRQLSMLLDSIGVETIVVDMPVGSMHLMGMLRILDENLAIAWPTRLAIRAYEALQDRGYTVAFLPDIPEAISGYALNGVTLAPRKLLMAANNPNTQSFYEDIGVTCVTVDVSELGKAAGAAGCLTGVLERET